MIYIFRHPVNNINIKLALKNQLNVNSREGVPRQIGVSLLSSLGGKFKLCFLKGEFYCSLKVVIGSLCEDTSKIN